MTLVQKVVKKGLQVMAVSMHSVLKDTNGHEGPGACHFLRQQVGAFPSSIFGTARNNGPVEHLPSSGRSLASRHLNLTTYSVDLIPAI